MKNKLISLFNWARQPEPIPESLNPRERTRRSLAYRYLRGNGIEIGALHTPLTVPKNASVRYVDRLSVEQLRQHYPELAELPLVEVDILDDGIHLETIANRSYNFAIANHVVEHLRNPILAIKNALRVLKIGGALYIAIPDKRYTFDRDRPLTPIDRLLREYRGTSNRSKRDYFEEYVRLVDKVPEEQVNARIETLLDMDYSIHYHVWTADTFCDFLAYCRDRLGFGFDIEEAQPNQDELICILTKQS